MDEEIQTIKHDKLKAYHSMVTISEALPGARHRRRRARRHQGHGRPRPGAGGAGPSHRRGARRHLCRHLLLLCGGHADRHQDQDRAREEAAPLHHRQADAAGLHERRHAAGGAGVRPQGHLRLRAALHRRGGARDAVDRAPRRIPSLHAKRRRDRNDGRQHQQASARESLQGLFGGRLKAAWSVCRCCARPWSGRAPPARRTCAASAAAPLRLGTAGDRYR